MVTPAVHIRVFQPSDLQAVQKLFCNEADELTKRATRAIFLGWSSISFLCAGVVGMLSIGTAHCRSREWANRYSMISATIGGIILWGTGVYLTCHWLTRTKVRQYLQEKQSQDLLDIIKYYKLKSGPDGTYEPEGKSNFWVCTPTKESSSIIGAIGFDYNPTTDEGQLSRLGACPGYKCVINQMLNNLINWAKQKGVRVMVLGSKPIRSLNLVDGQKIADDFDSIRHLIYLDLLSQYKKS
ncbi:hypothetical protein INT44_000081 [Umbelopsis vinacea]|uniref:N-acetyltransferase domain-containing protein n=1 Tax=Umbelopsis vinacea TaxID=44442 RepID=A0A8H7PHK2_9FUNG|nr:hypothetical protein INT44_000081 [Umbelopsis vinacea]KAI9287839.1 hypothetical protein BC943DRAFT_318936 [Umbelopsis sp. AD052]